MICSPSLLPFFLRHVQNDGNLNNKSILNYPFVEAVSRVRFYRFLGNIGVFFWLLFGCWQLMEKDIFSIRIPCKTTGLNGSGVQCFIHLGIPFLDLVLQFFHYVFVLPSVTFGLLLVPKGVPGLILGHRKFCTNVWNALRIQTWGSGPIITSGLGVSWVPGG